MTKTREVTKKDVSDAAMIAQLIGGADVAGAGFTCIERERRRLHDCPDCDHYERVDECTHANEWDCVPAAIGASPEAVDLWMKTSNALFTTAKDRKGELDYLRREGTKQEIQEHEQLYAWVDSIREGGVDHGDIGLNELEVASLLREGHLPPGWKLVAKKRPKPQPITKKRRENDVAAARKPPLIQINMTTYGPQALSPGSPASGSRAQHDRGFRDITCRNEYVKTP